MPGATRRNILMHSHIPDFIKWINTIQYHLYEAEELPDNRSSKGDYRFVEIRERNSQAIVGYIYRRTDQDQHLTVQRILLPLAEQFIKDNKRGKKDRFR